MLVAVAFFETGCWGTQTELHASRFVEYSPQLGVIVQSRPQLTVLVNVSDTLKLASNSIVYNKYKNSAGRACISTKLGGS